MWFHGSEAIHNISWKCPEQTQQVSLKSLLCLSVGICTLHHLVLWPTEFICLIHSGSHLRLLLSSHICFGFLESCSDLTFWYVGMHHVAGLERGLTELENLLSMQDSGPARCNFSTQRTAYAMISSILENFGMMGQRLQQRLVRLQAMAQEHAADNRASGDGNRWSGFLDLWWDSMSLEPIMWFSPGTLVLCNEWWVMSLLCQATHVGGFFIDSYTHSLGLSLPSFSFQSWWARLFVVQFFCIKETLLKYSITNMNVQQVTVWNVRFVNRCLSCPIFFWGSKPLEVCVWVERDTQLDSFWTKSSYSFWWSFHQLLG